VSCSLFRARSFRRRTRISVGACRYEVWRGHVAREQIVEPLVDEQLVVVEVEEREDLVLVEEVVAHRRLSEQVRLPQSDELAVAVEQIEQLRLQRGAGAAGVEVGKKRILRVLEHGGSVEPRRHTLGESGLPDAEWAFNGDVGGRHREIKEIGETKNIKSLITP
jgi:hypothetical protein